MSNKVPGPTLTSILRGALEAVPLRWRAKAGITRVTQKNPTDVAPAALSGGIVESAMMQDNNRNERNKVLVTLEGLAGSIVEKLMTQEGQIATRTTTLVDEGTALPTLSALTIESEQHAWGTGKSEQSVTVVPAIFDNKIDANRDGIEFPKKFLATPKLETIATTIAGTDTTPDALASNGLGIVNSQVIRDGSFKTRKTNETLSGTNTALTGFDYDEATGLLLPTTATVVAAGTAGVALATDGTYSTVEPINPIWSIKTTRKATALTNRTYNVWKHVTFPRVLISFSNVVFTDTNGNIVFAGFYHDLKDFSSQYFVTIYEAWSKDPHTLDGATVLRPQAFSWITPFGGGSVPECLHGAITISGNTASDGTTPVNGSQFYSYIVWSFAFAATSPANLSGTIVIEDTQQPWRGGYLRHKETITP